VSAAMSNGPRLPLRPRRSSGRARAAIRVEVLICGSIDRSDDGAAIVAAAALRSRIPAGVAVRIVGLLDIDDLLAVPEGAAVVIVDAACGISPGTVVELPLRALGEPNQVVNARSSHAIAVPAAIGLAEMVRGRPLPGRIVAIGGKRFGLGRRISRPVRAGIPELVEAILRAVADLGPPSAPRAV